MYLLLLVSLLGSALSVPLDVEDDVTRNVNYQHYLLPGESYPTFYDVRLFLNPDVTDSFRGDVTIRIVPRRTTNQIVLQAMEMQIHSIRLTRSDSLQQNLFLSFDHATDNTHFLTINSNTPLVMGLTYIVDISYTSRFAENMFGVYISTYEEAGVGPQRLITSQLQPTFARRAFPCYDEPAYKAVFRTTIYAPPAYPVVRSNMPERTDLLKPEVAGYRKFEFQDTLMMSSYLIAYLVSKFEYVTNEASPLYNVPFRVYSRPGTQNTATFALDFGQRNMIALENYTEFTYAFPKMDKAAVPDFAAGAMENWGLVIYREVALLVRDGITTTNTRQNIGRIICHENVHMWFGNEVSPTTWTYTWLNEGFANFFENFATDLVLPEWRMMDQFVLLLQNVFQNDAVLGVNPMTHPVFTPSQIIGTFNAVAYQKSGSVIRMMQHFLTPEVFRRGLVIYLRSNSRRAVTPPDLYTALQQALDESSHSIPWPLATVLDRWTNQGGFPVLTVRRSAPGAQSIFVSQERFLTNRQLSSYYRWHVPINWVLSTNADFSNTSPQGWVPPSFPAVSFDIPGLSNADWYIVNKQQTGYYRVNYDVENWQALARVLNSSHQTIHVLNRAQIVDDSFNLARNGRLNYVHAFEISRYLVQEADYIPWASANTALSYLDIVLSGSDVYDLYKTYMLELSTPLYDRLGFSSQLPEEHVTAYHRNIVLDIHCRLGNQHCVNRSQELLEQFRNNPSQRLNPDVQTTVFCSGLRGGDVNNFNFLWNQYLASTDSSEQSILLNALGCTSNAERRDFYLNQVISPTSAVRDQDRHSVIVSVINSSPQNMEVALDFVIEHFAAIQPRVQGLTGTTNILNAFARRLTTPQHSTKIATFITRHQSIFTAGELASIGAIQENIAASIAWSQQNYATVSSWLNENFRSNANTITSSLLILISIFIALYNM
ncbi:PREDICTED: aminopeptidase N-like [Papilio polytes]|uniref:aminopeptidase N-like n=1 Tax=Papilio polytes TaxID=76194 RepID=UPI00067625F6|nr:PREDICTED: aminopeptidase N-like [Papilio polytes]